MHSTRTSFVILKAGNLWINCKSAEIHIQWGHLYLFKVEIKCCTLGMKTKLTKGDHKVVQFSRTIDIVFLYTQYTLFFKNKSRVFLWETPEKIVFPELVSCRLMILWWTIQMYLMGHINVAVLLKKQFFAGWRCLYSIKEYIVNPFTWIRNSFLIFDNSFLWIANKDIESLKSW